MLAKIGAELAMIPLAAEYETESDHIKEVYAFFGLAYYLAGVFESGLAVAMLVLSFLADLKADHVRTKSFDRASFEAGLDDFMAQQRASTLGQLVKKVQEIVELDEPFKSIVIDAVKRRNFLAHHFFYERAAAFVTPTGRQKMLEELSADHELFERADQGLLEFIRPYQRRLGLDSEAFKNKVAEYMRTKAV